METMFTIKKEELDRYSPDESHIIFRELLYAESTRLEIPPSKITIKTDSSVKDGGIDAYIENDTENESGLIKKGQTGFQIKSGKTFEPWQLAELRNELFGERKEPNKNNLKKMIKHCLDGGGRYVIVCFGIELLKEQRVLAESNLRDILHNDCDYEDPQIDIFDQTGLIGFFKPYPSLCLLIKGTEKIQFQTHKSWGQDEDMRNEYMPDQNEDQLVSALQGELRGADDSIHIRILGEPGIGKTKLIYEATRREDLSPLVIYVSRPSNFLENPLLNEILRVDNDFYVILVVDDLDVSTSSNLWNKLRNRGPRIKLISIYPEEEEYRAGTTRYYSLKHLELEKIVEIIENYRVSKDLAKKWASYCDGNPRVAHIIGMNLREDPENPEDVLKEVDYTNLWKRFITGGDDPNDQKVVQRELTLRYLSIFKRFGFGRDLINEARYIAKLIEETDPQITWMRFQEIISTLRKRKILQGDITLYITPKLFHVWLWTEFWDRYGLGIELEDFSKKLKPKLREWFFEMFAYAKKSEVAMKKVREILGEAGPFQGANKEFLKSKLGANFFLILTEADPESALKCLNNTIGKWTKEERLEYKNGRREIIWALQKLARKKELFLGAARILLLLAEAENESYANNATGVFIDLFSPGPGKVAPTAASPLERLPIIKDAFNSGIKDRQMLVLKACERALQVRRFVRVIDNINYGFPKDEQFWTPKSYEEWIQGHRAIWSLLESEIDKLEENLQAEACNILINKIRSLGTKSEFQTIVFKTIKTLSKRKFCNREMLLNRISELLHFEKGLLTDDILVRWTKLKEELTGNDFPSLLKRYVGMSLLFEDDIDRDGLPIGEARNQIQQLAKDAIKNPALLRSELTWLLTDQANKAYFFGYELGKKDEILSLLPNLLKFIESKEEPINYSLINGYFRSIFERNREEWEKILDDLYKQEKYFELVFQLSQRSGVTDRSVLRILNLYKNGAITLKQLQDSYLGHRSQAMSEDTFNKWLKLLIETPRTEAIALILDFYFSYYVQHDSEKILPKELTLKLLTDERLFRKNIEYKFSNMDSFYWYRIASKFFELYPNESITIVEIIFQHFREEGTIIEGYDSYINNFLIDFGKKFPEQIWKSITQYFIIDKYQHDSRSFWLLNWMQRKNFLSLIPLKLIWGWIDEDEQNRASLIARYAPRALYDDNNNPTLSYKVLKRYGHLEDVRIELLINFTTGTEIYRPPASLHYQKKKEKFSKLKLDETNNNVLQWLNEYLAELDQYIDRAKMREERNEW